MGSHWRISTKYWVISARKALSRLLFDLRLAYSLVRFKVAYEHIYGIRLCEREAEEYIRRKAAVQQLNVYGHSLQGMHTVRNPTCSCPVTHDQSNKHPRS